MVKDHWRMRRRFMIATVVFCKAVIGYVLYNDMTSGSAETAISMAFLIIGSTVASYVFGAAWEDVNKHKRITPRGRSRMRYNNDDGYDDANMSAG